jgi:hypothetical protein
MRIFGWFRPRPAAAGRHTRVLPAASVPGAAAALVSNAFGDAVEDRLPRVVDHAVPERAAAVATDELLDTVPHAWVLGHVPEPPPPTAPGPVRGVGLGFSDGVEVELPADDPRVGTFQAAAAALLEAPMR